MKKMRKICTILVLLCTAAVPLTAEELVSGGFGINYYGYEELYLTTGLSYQVPLEEAMDLAFGADFGVSTEQTGGEIRANFLIPLHLGLNFPFPGQTVSYSFGTGISPNINYGDDISGVALRMGPYVHGLLRFQVHPVMSIFLRFEQNLLFGPPRWIYTGSNLALGISF